MVKLYIFILTAKACGLQVGVRAILSLGIMIIYVEGDDSIVINALHNS